MLRVNELWVVGMWVYLFSTFVRSCGNDLCWAPFVCLAIFADDFGLAAWTLSATSPSPLPLFPIFFPPAASYGSLARFKRLSRMHVASPNCILGVGGDYSDFQQLQTMVDAEMTAQYVANDGLSLSPKYVNTAV